MNKVNKKQSTPVLTNTLQNNMLLGLVVLFTMMLFSKCIHFQFVFYDDPEYITRNSLLKSLNIVGIYKIFTTPIIGMYNPLPFLVYAIEYYFWGFNPKYFHLTNLFFHLVAITTVYYFILLLSKRVETALIVALLFAVHPMHTGVVIWASQLKTSMYLVFYFLGLSQYIIYLDKDKQSKRLIYTFVFFLLSLLSKPSAISFPLVLMLIEYYRGNKITFKLLLQRAPFFVMSAIFVGLTLFTHKLADDNIFEQTHTYDWYNLILVMNYSFTFYIEKLLIPINLSPIYPYPNNAPLLDLKYYLSMLIIPGIIFLIYKSGTFRKEVVFGVLFFCFSIFAMLRLMPMGEFSFANRYSYLSYTGLFYIIGQFFVYLKDNKFKSFIPYKSYLYLFFGGFMIFLVWRTSIRISKWENSITLFSDVIMKYPNYHPAYNQRGMALIGTGNYEAAIRDVSKAIELKPDYAYGYANRAALYMELKKFDEAQKDLSMAIFLDPKMAAAYNNRAKCQIYNHNLAAAMEDYDRAIGENSSFKEAFLNRAILKLHFGDSTGSYNDAMKARSLGMEEASDFIDSNFE